MFNVEGGRQRRRNLRSEWEFVMPVRNNTVECRQWHSHGDDIPREWDVMKRTADSPVHLVNLGVEVHTVIYFWNG